MRYCIQSDEEADLFGPARGCAEFEQRLLRFDGPGEGSRAASHDELLYVLGGSGRATVDGEPVDLDAGTAVYAAAGTEWHVERAEGLEVLSVRVNDPLPAGAPHAVVAVDDVEADEATAGRMFRLLAPCASATQFVGYIPPGRAPDHFHTYDEVIYVLEGEGYLDISGEQAPIRAGTCIHLPKTLVHSLANTGDSEMRVLGVLRPAGSPAEAYYPDGTRAGM